jgi:hypothetical protein
LAVTSSISGGALVRAALPLPSRESVKAIP